jgi:transposase-like protein
VLMMAKERRQYSQEFKSEIVKPVLEGRRTVPEICTQHGLHGSSVYAWVRQVKIDEAGQGASAVTTADALDVSAPQRLTLGILFVAYASR